MTTATVIAGVPNVNKAVFHRVRYWAGDPMCWVRFEDGRTIVILRDVELAGARASIGVDAVHTYEDFAPEAGLSNDRAVRAAQALAECLRREGVTRAFADRSLALLYADELHAAGVGVVLDRDLGVLDRRRKTDDEVAAMRTAQRGAEEVIRLACEFIAGARADDDGWLVDAASGEGLTSESVMARIDGWLAERGLAHDGCIVAGGPVGADCHASGTGPLRSGEPVIVDVFPRDRATGYYGDCTRSVVHGEIPGEVARMHEAVLEAKGAGEALCRVGHSGDDVHRAVAEVIERHGYTLAFPPEEQLAASTPTGFCSMPHGTGHGLGLDLKEPPLLDFGGPALVEGDAVTVEPGLYAPGLGGIRLEDIVIVREGGYENLNTLPLGLTWS